MVPSTSAMAGVADQDDFPTQGPVTTALVVHLGNQRTGGVDHRQVPFSGQLLDPLGDAVGGEDGHGAGRDFVQFVDEHSPAGAQVLDHVAIVDDFVPDVDRRTVFLQRPLDDFDCPLNAGAEAAGLSQEHADHGLISKRRRWSAPSRAESPTSRAGYGMTHRTRQCRRRAGRAYGTKPWVAVMQDWGTELAGHTSV